MAFGPPDLHDHPAPYQAAMHRGLVRAKCLHVVDGDTYDFLLDLGWYQYTYGRVRLRGADTPETHTETLEAGRAAKARAAELLLDRHALVRTHKGERSFDRFIADVWVPALEWHAPEGVTAIGVPQGTRWWSLAELLVFEGHAVRLVDGKRVDGARSKHA